jgi:hypothetical protein
MAEIPVVAPKRGQKILKKRLDKSRMANEAARRTAESRAAPSGNRASAQETTPRKKMKAPSGNRSFAQKDKSRQSKKSNLPVKRGTTQPAEYKKPSTSVTEYKKPSTSVTEYKKPSTAVTEYKKPTAGGGAVRKSEGLLDKAQRYAKGPIGLGGAALGLYLGDTFSSKTGNQANYGEQAWIDDKKNRGPLMKGNSTSGKTDRERPKAGRDDRASSGGSSAPKSENKNKPVTPINRDNLNDKGKKIFDGKQGQSGKKKPASPVVPSAPSGRSSGRTNLFERGKQRMYEKEGYGGRSMTAPKARGQVEKERKYTFKDLFKKK